MTTLPTAGANEHGTHAYGKRSKCPCPPCREAVNSYRRRVYRQQGYGTWEPFVDSELARQHLIALKREGVSMRVIANHLGKREASINAIVYAINDRGRGRRTRIRPEFAAAILALTVAEMETPTAPAAGSSRRIRALNAMGWPSETVCTHLNILPARVSELGKQKRVTRATAETVARVYEQLKDQRPEDHGIPAPTIKRVSGRARRMGWRDPLWWEDMGGIDDPDFNPAAVEEETTGRALAALRREEIAHLASFNLGHEEIGARLDMAPGYVRDVLRELRAGQRQNRKAVA